MPHVKRRASLVDGAPFAFRHGNVEREMRAEHPAVTRQRDPYRRTWARCSLSEGALRRHFLRLSATYLALHALIAAWKQAALCPSEPDDDAKPGPANHAPESLDPNGSPAPPRLVA